MPYSPRSCTWKSLAVLLFPLICLSQEPAQNSLPIPVQKQEGDNGANDKKIAKDEHKNEGVNIASISAIAGGVGAIVAGILAGCFLLMSKRIDEKNTIRTLAAQLALEQWKAMHAVNLERHFQSLKTRNLPSDYEKYVMPNINPIIEDMGRVVGKLVKTK